MLIKITSAVAVAVLGFVVAGSPMAADAAAMISGRFIEDDTVRSRDIRDDTVRSRDVKAGSLRRTDLAPGVLAGHGGSTSSGPVTTLRSWTFHVNATDSGRAEIVSAEALPVPVGTRLSPRNIEVTGDAASCPTLSIAIRPSGGVRFAERYSGEGWGPTPSLTLTDLRITTPPTPLEAELNCYRSFDGNRPLPALDVTVVFETTSPAEGPAVPLN